MRIIMSITHESAKKLNRKVESAPNSPKEEATGVRGATSSPRNCEGGGGRATKTEKKKRRRREEEEEEEEET